MSTLAFSFGLLFGMVFILLLFWIQAKFNKEQQLQVPGIERIQPPTPVIHVEAPLDPRINDLIDVIAELPHKVLESITSSANNQKGRLGELIGYLNLNSKYDRLIALRDITDFLAIRFPKNGVEGSVDFIDVKNGPSARLSKDQTQLKNLIKNGKVQFLTFKVETSSGSDSLPED